MNIPYSLKRFFITLVCFVVVSVPTVSFAASTLIVCGESNDSGVVSNPCTFGHLIVLFDKIIEFFIKTLFLPLVTLAALWAGWLVLNGGNKSDNITKAKDIFIKILIGSFWVLAGWLVVKTILVGIGFDEGKFESFLGK